MGPFFWGFRPGTSGSPGLPLAPQHHPATGHCAWASATQGSLQQSKQGEKQQLWHVPCKGTIHCGGSEPDPHPRLRPSACSDEAESRYFSSLEREHQENERDGNPSWCFGATSLGDWRRPHSPRQGRLSSLLPAPSPRFSAPLCTQVPSTAFVQRHPAVALLQPELPRSSPAPLGQCPNCHSNWPDASGCCSLQLWENKRLLFHLFLAANLLLSQLCPFGSSPDPAKNTAFHTGVGPEEGRRFPLALVCP